MKKLVVLLVTVMVICGLSACGTNVMNEKVSEESISVVTTIFPEYDWAKQIIGDAQNVELTMLLDSGVDLHSYQPSADDIIRISTCDLFIYIGGESDGWVKDALKEATNPDMVVINLMDVLGADIKEEELKEGMEAEKGEDSHSHEGEHEDDGDAAEGEHEGDGNAAEGEEETEYDEHIWLSLKNAQRLVQYISDALIEIDAEQADLYVNNTISYISRLQALDKEFVQTVGQAKEKTLLFGDRFPFRYLADDYGLDYYAAFIGCSAETEASFETIAFLSGKVDELGLTSVLTIEGTEHRIAETIIQNTAAKNQQILTMDSMQSVTSGDVEAGTSYISIMEKNLETLKATLK